MSKSEAMLDDNKEDNQLLSPLQFILCQLDNLFRPKTHRIYNIGTIVMALKCQLISPAYYHYLQSLDAISLPHHTTLQRLYTKFGLDSEYITFLEKATCEFNQRERNVIVQIDEIHVKSEFTYKGYYSITILQIQPKLYLLLWFPVYLKSIVRQASFVYYHAQIHQQWIYSLLSSM